MDTSFANMPLKTAATAVAQPSPAAVPDAPAQSPLPIWLRVAEVLESIAAFCWLGAVIAAFASEKWIAFGGFILFVISFFGALGCTLYADKRSADIAKAAEKDEASAKERVQQARSEMATIRCLLTEERIAGMEKEGVNAIILSALRRILRGDTNGEIPKDPPAEKEMEGRLLRDDIDRRVGRDQVDGELPRLIRALKFAPPDPPILPG
jgi:hypothetical protein